MMVRVKHKQEVIAEDILLADNLWSRLIGLMFRAEPPQKAKGLLLHPCNSIHTFFMRYPLDVVFMDSDNKIVKIIRSIKPWRMTWIYFRASKTLELPAGELSQAISLGDVLEVEDV